MISINSFIKKALAFEEAVEEPHFEKRSFRVNRKIFVTLNTAAQTITVKLSVIDQSVFTAYNKEIIYPATGAWGKQGWTIIELRKVRASMVDDILKCAYCNVAPLRLGEKYK